MGDERIQTVFSLIHEIDSALLSHSGKKRLEIVNTILVRCWGYIEDFSEMCKQRQDEAAASGENTELVELLKNILGSMAGTSEICEGSTAPVTDSSSEEESASATAEMREKTHDDAEQTTGSEPENENPQTESENGNSASGSGAGR